MAAKYAPLTQYLAAQPGATVTLTFADIEALLGAPLPASARRRTDWWGNHIRSQSHTRAWTAVGWRVQRVNRGAVCPPLGAQCGAGGRDAGYLPALLGRADVHRWSPDLAARTERTNSPRPAAA